VGIDIIGLQDDLHLPAVTMGKSALIWVMGQHVPILNFKGFTDSVGHVG
jgi:hypothetical protein